MKEKIRKPICAGTWYNASAAALSAELDEYLELAEEENHRIKPRGGGISEYQIPNTKYQMNVKAIIVPHAGYMYSGQTAACAFRQINRNINKVIILGTAHHYTLTGACVIDYDAYDSPLGKVKLSPEVKNLLKEENIASIPAADEREHSIEIEIPFLQRVLKDFSIIPVIVGRIDPEEFASLLEKYSDDKTLIVCSADLSHFHSYNEAVKLDKYSLDSILDLNAEAINEAEIDSPWAVMSLIELAKRKNWKTKLLDYKNSGDIIKDKSSVVGYGAVAFYSDTEKFPADEKVLHEKEIFTPDEKYFMRRLAKQTVETFVREGKRFQKKDIPESFKQNLKSSYACFVTLRNYDDELRGCIGTIEPFDTLYNSIIENAISAASRDYRFSPVGISELAGLKYEVSVLTKPEQIFPEDINGLFWSIKNRGVIIEQNYNHAVYLPQVWEQLSSPEEFLGSLCRKAGLTAKEWKNFNSMKYSVFSLIE
jgi:hypothetical protein